MDGLHVPLILLVDTLDNEGTDPPVQILNDVPKLNVGVMFGVTITLKVVLVAHSPGVGIKV